MEEQLRSSFSKAFEEEGKQLYEEVEEFIGGGIPDELTPSLDVEPADGGIDC